MPWSRERQHQSPNVQQLCQWFESAARRDQAGSSTSSCSGMDGRLPTVEEFRTTFLRKIQVFEHQQTPLAQSGSTRVPQTAVRDDHVRLSSLTGSTTTPVSDNVSQASYSFGAVSVMDSHKGGESRGEYRTYPSTNSVSISLASHTLSTTSVSVTMSSAASQCMMLGSCSSTTGHIAHHPVIQEKNAERQTERTGRPVKKNTLFRVMSSHSGLANRLRVDGVTNCHSKTASCQGASHVMEKTFLVNEKPHLEQHRKSVADPQDLLNPRNHHFHRRGHRGSYESAMDNLSLNSRLVSTASIQLAKQPVSLCRKRSSSEERRISVIQTSKCFPEPVAKPSSMLDEWLSSLVNQTKVQPHEENMVCVEDSVLTDHHSYNNLCSENAWQHLSQHRSFEPCRYSGVPTVRMAARHAGSSVSSEQCWYSGRTKEHFDVLGMSAEPCANFKQSKKYAQHISGEKVGLQTSVLELVPHSSGEKVGLQTSVLELVPHSSGEKVGVQTSVLELVPGSGISIQVTEEDEDSACVQSVSDSASVQLCVPLNEDSSVSPIQHLPLSPCSSLGSYHSAVSSNADSAVDMAMPEDDALEVEMTPDGNGSTDSTSPSGQLKPNVHSVCSSSSSSCHIPVESVGVSLPRTLPVQNITTSIKRDLPSFLISDHSSMELDGGAKDSDLAIPDSADGTDGSVMLELTFTPRSPSAASSSSEGSYCSTCWTDSSVSDAELSDRIPKPRKKQSSWKKIRSIIRWSPFIQVFKKHRYPWIQLAGHQGNFQAGEAGSVLKKLDSREHQSLQRLMQDRLQPYVPEFRGVVEKSGERYVQLQDLLCEFSSPCVMDIKMGTRTYLEEELHKARKKPTLRKDMYQKMVDVDSNAPTAEEHCQRAVTKPRYMQWRDQMSSSVDLGFRIEGIKKCDGASSKDFKKTKTRDTVADVLKAFIGDDEIVLTKYLQRLRDINATQESSEFFQSHEVIGSSLLFVHDSQGKVNVWMIDFGKTEPLPKGTSINHRSKWVEGNHEDGYQFGLDNIISILEELQASSVA